MDITCEQCESKFKIPDSKIPAGKTVAIKCPKCQNRISVTGKTDTPATTSAAVAKAAETSPSASPFAGFMEDDEERVQGDEKYESSEKPFDFMEEEGKTALICEADAAAQKKIKDALTNLDYHITVAENARDALKKMRYHGYDLVVVNEGFYTNNPDSNGVLIYLERLQMSMRRNIFVALVSRRYRTMDHMMAFNKSVNLIVNATNLDDFDKVISRGITDFELFYRVYKEAARKVGKE